MAQQYRFQRPRGPSHWPIIGIALAVVFAVVLWMLTSCGERAAAGLVTGAATTAAEALPSAPAPADTRDAEAQLKAARSRASQAEHQVEIERAEVHRLEDVRDELARQDLRRRLAWLGGLVLIGVLASVGLWFILPAGLKSWAVYGGLGCLGVAAAAFALRALVPYLELIGWGMVGAGVLFGLWKLARFKRAGIHAANAFDQLEEAFVGMKDWIPTEKHQLVDDLVAQVKHDAATDQAGAGVREVLAAIRGKDPKAPTKPTLPPLVVA